MSLITTHIVHRESHTVPTVPSEVIPRQEVRISPTIIRSEVMHDPVDEVPFAGGDQANEIDRFIVTHASAIERKQRGRKILSEKLAELESQADAYDAMNNSQKQAVLLNRGSELLRNDALLARALLNQWE